MIKFNRGLSFVSEIMKAFCIGLKPREIIDTKQLKQIQTNFRNVKSIFSQAIFSLLLFFQTCDRTNQSFCLEYLSRTQNMPAQAYCQ